MTVVRFMFMISLVMMDGTSRIALCYISDLVHPRDPARSAAYDTNVAVSTHSVPEWGLWKWVRNVLHHLQHRVSTVFNANDNRWNATRPAQLERRDADRRQYNYGYDVVEDTGEDYDDVVPVYYNVYGRDSDFVAMQRPTTAFRPMRPSSVCPYRPPHQELVTIGSPFGNGALLTLKIFFGLALLFILPYLISKMAFLPLITFAAFKLLMKWSYFMPFIAQYFLPTVQKVYPKVSKFVKAKIINQMLKRLAKLKQDL